MDNSILELTDSATLAKFRSEVALQGTPPLACYVSAQQVCGISELLAWRKPLDLTSYVGDPYPATRNDPVSLIFGTTLSEHNIPLAGIDLEQAVYALMANLTRATLHRRIIQEGTYGFLMLAIGPVGLLGHCCGYGFPPDSLQDVTALSFAYLEKHGCVFDYDRYGWKSGL